MNFYHVFNIELISRAPFSYLYEEKKKDQIKEEPSQGGIMGFIKKYV